MGESNYIIKDIPLEIRHMRIDGEENRADFKGALFDYLEREENENGLMLHGIDFFCNIAIFRHKKGEN